METQKRENKRRFISFFTYPMLRIRFGGLYGFIGLCTVAVLNFSLIYFLVYYVNSSSESPTTGSDVGQRLLHTLASQQWLVISVFVMLTALLVGFAWVVSNRIAGPILPLLRHIEALKKGDYEHKTQLRKSDELKPLMHALNELSDELKSNKRAS